MPPAKALLHLTSEAIELLAQRRDQAVQTLPVLFIDTTAALFKDAIGEVFKLGAETLLAVGQQALLLFGGKAGFFKTDSDFAQLRFLSAVNLQLIAQFTAQLLAFIAPVVEVLEFFPGGGQRAMQLTQLFSRCCSCCCSI